MYLVLSFTNIFYCSVILNCLLKNGTEEYRCNFKNFPFMGWDVQFTITMVHLFWLMVRFKRTKRFAKNFVHISQTFAENLAVFREKKFRKRGLAATINCAKNLWNSLLWEHLKFYYVILIISLVLWRDFDFSSYLSEFLSAHVRSPKSAAIHKP